MGKSNHRDGNEEIVQLKDELSKLQVMLTSTEKALQARTYEQNQWAKEMDCLYRLSLLIDTTDNLREIMERTVEMLPSVCGDPKSTCARIIIGSQEYRTPNFQETARKQSCEILEHGQQAGKVEVFYLEKKPGKDGIPFLKEESRMLQVIAIRLGDVIERIQAEEVLKTREAIFRSLIEQASDGFVLTDDSGIIIEWNQAAEQIIGVRRAEALGRYLWDVQFEASRADFRTLENYRRLKTMLEDFYRTKQPPWGNPLQETSFQRPDGSLAVVQSGIFPIQLEGSFLACGIIRDVTERKLIEQEREQQAEHRIRELEAVFAAMTDSIIVYDVDGSPVYANPAFHAMYGLDPIGMERGSLVDKIAMRHQDGRLLSGDEIPSTRALRGETVQDMPILFADTRGKQHYKLTSAAPFIVDGKLSGAVVASHDITDHIQAEREVRQARDEMATLLNISQNIVSTLELQPLLDMILEELASVVSYTTASIITFEQDQASIRSYRGMRQSQEMRTISFSLDRIPLLQQAIDNQREFYIADGRHLPDLMLAVQAEINQPLDTITRYRTWFGVPLVVKGRPIGLLLLLHTEPDYYSSSVRGLVRAFALQAAIAIENARLYQEAGKAAALAERSRLAGELHDAVSQTLFSASLIAEVLPVVWGENPGSALKALNELRELTRGALAEMRTLLAELRPAYLTEKPLGELVSTLVHTASHRGGIPITISLRCDSPLPPDVQIAIYRIAQEALNNILKHAKASRAEVMLGCMDGQVQLQIQDNGCGFDPEIVAPEQRGMGTMRERARGIGAELDIWSQPGEGTKITVRWSAA